MKKLSWISICALAGALQLSAQAPGAGMPPPPPMHGGRGFGALGMGMHGGKTVTGQPYSADVNNTMVQTLADGNTITHSTSGHVARDAQGRTYLEETLTGGPLGNRGPKTVTFLSDPVAGYTYVLEANRKVAMRRPIRTADSTDRPPRADGDSPTATSANRVEADLGQQVVNGVAAQGKSITRTIPAETMGNAQPLVEKSEIWTAPDLQVVVMATHTDPRMGKSTYTLNNIQRAAPSASLFQVPAGYSVEDAPAFGRGPERR